MKGEEKKKVKVRQEKSSLGGTCCAGLCVPNAVGLLTLAIRASVVNAHPDRTLILLVHNGTRETSSKTEVFPMGEPLGILEFSHRLFTHLRYCRHRRVFYWLNLSLKAV